ncbi:TetR/AcrR family transcriptional regulator [Gordonia jacobaea]|uniref:TetR/AcrR family transcriptional regulator n=1 Tax=Gordonia jacobaea TaxID=122202 RepID=UPI003D74D328
MTTQQSPVAPTGRPLRADAERNRRRIIAAAHKLFAERGLDVSLDDVAAAAGVGVGTVYRRFANRDELIVGVFAAHLEEVAEQTEGVLAADSDPWASVVTMVSTVCTAMAEDRGLAAIIMQIDHTDPTIATVKARMTKRMGEVFDRAHAAGVLREDIVETDIFSIFSMVSSYADITEATVPGAWKRYLQLLLDAIHAAPPSEPLRTPALTEEQIHEVQACRIAFRRGGGAST